MDGRSKLVVEVGRGKTQWRCTTPGRGKILGERTSSPHNCHVIYGIIEKKDFAISTPSLPILHNPVANKKSTAMRCFCGLVFLFS